MTVSIFQQWATTDAAPCTQWCLSFRPNQGCHVCNDFCPQQIKCVHECACICFYNMSITCKYKDGYQ